MLMHFMYLHEDQPRVGYIKATYRGFLVLAESRIFGRILSFTQMKGLPQRFNLVQNAGHGTRVEEVARRPQCCFPWFSRNSNNLCNVSLAASKHCLLQGDDILMECEYSSAAVNAPIWVSCTGHVSQSHKPN